MSSEDIHVYSIDEVFMDVTQYQNIYKVTAHELAMRMNFTSQLRHNPETGEDEK